MPEYTIRIVDRIQYHLNVNEAEGLRALNLDNNGQLTVTLDNDAAFGPYISTFCDEFIEAYDLAQNLNSEAVQEALTSEGSIWEENQEANYTYVIVEYEINGQEATITVEDYLDTGGQEIISHVSEHLEEEAQQPAFQAAIPQFFDTLVPNGIIPRIVAVGTTFTLEQFRQLGPFRIERKLFYDDFGMSAKEVDCTFQAGHKEYPVLTIPQNQVYCMTEILPWVFTKNTDPYTRGIIEQFRIMNEQDIEKKELEEFTKEKEKKEKEREEKKTSGADRRDIRKLDYRIRELERTIRERKTEKTKRIRERKTEKTKRINLQRLSLKF